MKTVLDGTRYWALESAVFSRDLVITVVELVQRDQPEVLRNSGVDVGPVHRLEPGSRRVRISFGAPVAYQVIDESVSIPHKDETHDGGTLRRFTESRYLRHLRDTAFFDLPPAADSVHYQLVTGDHVVDVISKDPPSVWVLETGEGA